MKSLSVLWGNLLESHLRRYPLMALNDFYKLTYQAANGMSHLLVCDKAEDYFFNEIKNVIPDHNEQLCQSIHPSDVLFRLNLAKSKDLGIDPNIIWENAVKSAILYQPSKKKMIEYWEIVSDFIEINIDCIPSIIDKDLTDFKAFVLNNNYPLMHHSSIFREEYSPSYRLIHKQHIEKIIGSKNVK